ncbi:MAG TPA: hypothetical protein VGQ10_04875 [Vicinamibacterales bacterium]|nr:hypothetical protein [Vicinamibacterales bacterium]
MVQTIPYRDARPVLESLRRDLLPDDLRSKTPAEIEAAWPDWVAEHDRATRARIGRGDRDSIVNFLLFGTTFTSEPRATAAALLALNERPHEALSLFARRIDDLVAALAAPGSNERLQFARRFVERQGMQPETAAGRLELRRYLTDSLRQAPAEVVASARTLDAAKAQRDVRAGVLERTLFRERGLSSDTSILVDFALDQTLEMVNARGLLASGRVRNVGVVGPGLDFTDKHYGYDFYPQQTIQPFAVIDSLVRLGLARAGQIRLTTFDVNERITEHIETARVRAREGQPYELTLPRDLDAPWSPALVSYWERFGAGVGTPAGNLSAPPNAGNVRVRGVRVRPDVVTSIVPRTLNIVLERLEGLASDERFDLIVATDVLIYYDVFEQSLALANLAAMLRPGGLLLSNNALFQLPAIPIAEVGATDVVHMPMPGLGDLRDLVHWYQR